jgi:hypothetical protein
MGVHQAQPPQQAFAEGIIRQVGNQQAPLVAYQDIGQLPGAVDQDTDLTPDFAGQFYQFPGQIRGDQFGRGDAPAIKPLQ